MHVLPVFLSDWVKLQGKMAPAIAEGAGQWAVSDGSCMGRAAKTMARPERSES